MANTEKHLYHLDELSDYKVSDGYSNVKGWKVKDRDNRVVGEVENLLVNKEQERVVYLDVHVDNSIIDAKYDPYTNPANPEVREFVNNDGENHIIIPIGLVDINDDDNYVYTETVDHRTFAETKRYRKGDHISRDYEVAVLDSYDRRTDINEDKIRDIVREEVREAKDDLRQVERPSKDEIRDIVRDEVQNTDTVNVKEAELKNEERLREIVRDEVRSDRDLSRDRTDNDVVDDLESRRNESLEDRRERLHRDDVVADNTSRDHHNDRGMDFDHDNDGNPNITDPDYYKKKARDIKNADYDNDNDGNPNITDPDYYEEKGRRAKNADYDHDNDGNPNITDPDYYEEKLEGNDTDRNRDDEFYKRKMFDDSNWRRRKK